MVAKELCNFTPVEAHAKKMSDVLTRDSDWAAFDGQVCKVTRFTPLATIENGRIVAADRITPYALVAFECSILSNETIGSVAHKVDFANLWNAYQIRGVGGDEEVIIAWNKRNLRGIAKLFSYFMPGLAVMICKSGSYELMTDPDAKPELSGQARYLALKPIAEWLPKVLS